MTQVGAILCYLAYAQLMQHGEDYTNQQDPRRLVYHSKLLHYQIPYFKLKFLWDIVGKGVKNSTEKKSRGEIAQKQ